MVILGRTSRDLSDAKQWQDGRIVDKDAVSMRLHDTTEIQCSKQERNAWQSEMMNAFAPEHVS